MDCIEQVMASKANSIPQSLNLSVLRGYKGAECVIDRVLIKEQILQRLSDTAVAREFQLDIAHDLFLIAGFSHEIAEQVDDLVGHFLFRCAAELFFRNILQHPERCASPLCALLRHVLPGFRIVDGLVILQIEYSLHIGFKLTPNLRAGGKIVVDDFLLTHACNHRCKRLIRQRPGIIVAPIPAELAANIVAQQEAENIAARHVVVIAKGRFFKLLPEGIQLNLHALREALRDEACHLCDSQSSV